MAALSLSSHRLRGHRGIVESRFAGMKGGRFMIRIVAEDQKMLRGAFASLLNFEDDIEVVAEVPDGDEPGTRSGASAGRVPA